MKKVSGILVILFAATLGAQTVPVAKPQQAVEAAKTKEITVASSAAEDSLLSLYKDFADNKKKANDTLQQARSVLDAKNKPILDKIAPLQKQIEANNEEASSNFATAVQPFNSNLARDQAQIDAIADLIKKEQSLPKEAVFDLATGKWEVPDVPATPAKK